MVGRNGSTRACTFGTLTIGRGHDGESTGASAGWPDPPVPGLPMPARMRTSGCLVSVVASLVLTLALNLLLRACAG